MHIPRFIRYSVLALALSIIPAPSFAGVIISVGIAPPALPVYVQPACPGDGYIWTPGYWAYGPDGYYWVPGTWVLAPEPGLLWTPGYWGWGGNAYIWHGGYWGPHVGFYGGINYGFGYFGAGYAGGYWHGRDFYYNRSVNNVNVTNVHIYNKTVINNYTVNRVSYNGHGGIDRRPDRNEERWDHERHFEPTHTQIDHESGARGNREFLASVNHGRPNVAATARPGEFRGHDAVPARGPNRPEGRPMGNNVPRPNNGRPNNERPNNERPNNARPNNERTFNERPNNGRSMERPAPHQEARGNGGGPRPNAVPRPAENRGGPDARPAGRVERNAPRENMQPRGNPQPRGNAAPRGNPQPRGNEGHGNPGQQHGNPQHGGNEGHERR